jgi:hypothetical protein
LWAVCGPPTYAPKDERKALVEQLVAGRTALGEAGDCTLYAYALK